MHPFVDVTGRRVARSPNTAASAAFGNIVERRAGAVRIDEVDRCGGQPRALERFFEGGDRAAPSGCGAVMVCIAR